MDPYEPQDPWNRGDTHAPVPPHAFESESQSAELSHTPEQHPQQPGQPPPSSWQIFRLFVAWSSIVICTVALFFLQAIGMSLMQEAYEDDARPGFNTLYLARYAVGWENLIPGAGKQMQAQFDDAAFSTPHETEAHIRSITVAGEIDARSLDRRLDALRAKILFAQDDAADDGRVIERIYADNYVPTASERDQLIAHHGWFGELAASYNQSKQSSAYQSARRSGTVVALTIVVLFLTVILAFIAGLVLAICAIVFTAKGTLRFVAPTGPAGHRTAYLESVALFLILFIVLQLVLGGVQELTGINMMLPILVLAATPIFWPLLAGVSWPRFKNDMGYHFGRGLLREIGAGIVGYITGLPVIAIGLGITFLLGFLAKGQADHPMQYELLDGGPFVIWLTLGAAVIWAPLVEESIFRAGFYRHLRQWRGVGGLLFATGITALVFAAIHPQGWIGIPVLMSIAFVLSGLREWRGSIIPSMVAHAIHNGIVSLILGVVLFA